MEVRSLKKRDMNNKEKRPRSNNLLHRHETGDRSPAETSEDLIRRYRETAKRFLQLPPKLREPLLNLALVPCCKDGRIDLRLYKENFDGIFWTPKEALEYLVQEGYIMKKGRRYYITQKGRNKQKELRELLRYGFI